MRPKISRYLTVTFVLGLLIGTTACHQKEEAAPLVKIRFAYQNRIGSAIPIIAVEKNFLKKENLLIRPIRFSNGPACAEALYTGSADIATMGDATAVYAVSRHSNQKIFVSHSTGEHRHRIIVKKNTAYQSIEDLQGQRVGIKKGTSTHGGFLAMLRSRGIPLDTIQIVDLNPNVMPDALIAGSIDAFAASEPTPSLAERKNGRELLSLGGLGNEYPILMLSKGSFLKEHKKEISLFIKALVAAESYIREHPDETANILAEMTGLPIAVAKKAMQQHTYRLCLNQKVEASLHATARFLKNEKKVTKIPDWSTVLDTTYIN